MQGSNEEEGRGARETSRLERSSREEKQAHMQGVGKLPARRTLLPPSLAAGCRAGRSLH